MVQTNGQIVQKREEKPSVLDMLVSKLSGEKMKKQFATACPTHLKVNAERYVRQFCTQIRLNPKLAECEQSSLVGAMMTGTALGLDPSPSLGEFYIIPYENRRRGLVEAQFQLGYKGMVALAYRGGVKRFEAHAIHEKDHFDYSLGMTPRLEHKPYLSGSRGNAIAYYAIALLPSGETVFEIMSRPDVEAHAKRYSRSYNDGPWKTEFDEMAKKTVAKSLFKWIPKSTEFSVAISKDGGVARIDGDIRSSDDVLDADVRYVEPEDDAATSNEALANEILASSQTQALLDMAPESSAPIEPEMIDLGPTQNKPAPQPTQEAKASFTFETDKLREQLTGILAINFTEDESSAWFEKNFGKTMKALTRDDLKAAISKINAELDAKELGV
jgi:recombination protein RecT